MAHSYGKLYCEIWKPGSGFRRLSMDAQRLYMLLVSQDDLSACGVLPLTIGRWSQMACDATIEATWQAASELASALFIVIDKRTEELLIRKFIKWDEGYKNRFRLIALQKSVRSVASPELLQVIASELAFLGVEHEIEQAPLQAPYEGASQATTEGAQVNGYLSRQVETSTTTQTSTMNRASSTPPPIDSDPWLFTEFWDAYPRRANKAEARVAWSRACKKHHPDEIVRAARRFATDPNLSDDEKFIPYPAKWLDRESWNAGPMDAPRPRHPPSTTDQRVAAGMALAAELDAESETRQRPQLGA